MFEIDIPSMGSGIGSPNLGTSSNSFGFEKTSEMKLGHFLSIEKSLHSF